MSQSATAAAPRSTIDLFCDAALDDPYPHYRELRDAGPAVHLDRHGLWFLGRHDVVRQALSDWQTWSSARGIGLNPVINEAWSGALIHTDPPAHTELRKLFADRLGPRHLKPVEQTIQRRAEELAARIVERGRFDAVKDVAQDLPVNVIMDLIGWPQEVRGELLQMAEGSFDACGPDNPRMQAALPRLDAMMQFLARTYDEDRLEPGGFGATVADAARRGEISREQVIGLLAGYVVAAFDTTMMS